MTPEEESPQKGALTAPVPTALPRRLASFISRYCEGEKDKLLFQLAVHGKYTGSTFFAITHSSNTFMGERETRSKNTLENINYLFIISRNR